MRAKEFFCEVRNAKAAIDEIEARRRHYIESATRMSGMSETRIRSTENRSRVEAAALSLVELADEMDEAAEVYAARIVAAEKLLEALTNTRWKQLLRLRYLECRPWRDVSEAMKYEDSKSVFRAHGFALQAAQEILDAGTIPPIS